MPKPGAIPWLERTKRTGQKYTPPHQKRGHRKPFSAGSPILGNHALELKGPSLKEGLKLLELKKGPNFIFFKNFYHLHQTKFQSAFRRMGASVEGITSYSFLLCVYEGLNTLGTTMPQADLSLRLDVLLKLWGISPQGKLFEQPQIDLLYKIGAANIASQTPKLFLQALLPLLTRALKPAEAASEKAAKNLAEGSNFDFLLLGLQNITSLYQRQIERIEKQIEEERQAQAAAAKKRAEEAEEERIRVKKAKQVKTEERIAAIRQIKVKIAEAVLELSFTGKELTDVKIAAATPESLDLEVLAILAEIGRIVRQAQTQGTTKAAEPIREAAEKVLVEATLPLVKAEKEQQQALTANATELTQVYDKEAKKAFITFDSFLQKVVTGLKLLPKAISKQLSAQDQKAKAAVIALAYRLGTIVEKLSKQANKALAEYFKTTDQTTEIKVFNKPKSIEHFETGLKFVVKKPGDFTRFVANEKRTAVVVGERLSASYPTPLETVIAYGKLFNQTKEAAQTRNIDRLAKTIQNFVGRDKASPFTVRGLTQATCTVLIKQALVEAGPIAIPTLLAAKTAISSNLKIATEVAHKATQFIDDVLGVITKEYPSQALAILTTALFTRPGTTKSLALVPEITTEGKLLLSAEGAIANLLDFYTKARPKSANSKLKTLLLSRQDKKVLKQAEAVERMIVKALDNPASHEVAAEYLVVNHDAINNMSSTVTDKLYAKLFSGSTSPKDRGIEEKQSNLDRLKQTKQRVAKNNSETVSSRKVKDPHKGILILTSKLVAWEQNVEATAREKDPDKQVEKLESARKELAEVIAAAASLNLKVSLDGQILSLCYALIHEKSPAAKSVSAAVALVAPGESRATRALKRIIEILEGEIYTAVGKDYKGKPKSGLNPEFLLSGLIMQRVAALTSAAVNIVAVLQRKREVWKNLVKAIENQQTEEVTEVLDRLISNARSMAQAAKKRTFDREVLENALAAMIDKKPSLAVAQPG